MTMVIYKAKLPQGDASDRLVQPSMITIMVPAPEPDNPMSENTDPQMPRIPTPVTNRLIPVTNPVSPILTPAPTVLLPLPVDSPAPIQIQNCIVMIILIILLTAVHPPPPTNPLLIPRIIISTPKVVDWSGKIHPTMGIREAGPGSVPAAAIPGPDPGLVQLLPPPRDPVSVGLDPGPYLTGVAVPIGLPLVGAGQAPVCSTMMTMVIMITITTLICNRRKIATSRMKLL